RFLVAPPWETPPPANGRLVLTLEPGRAFGTGQHATTAGCLELLETIVERVRPTRAIDLGTGSGILAIAAARLGVPDVLAIDAEAADVTAALAAYGFRRVEARSIEGWTTLAYEHAPLRDRA